MQQLMHHRLSLQDSDAQAHISHQSTCSTLNPRELNKNSFGVYRNQESLGSLKSHQCFACGTSPCRFFPWRLESCASPDNIMRLDPPPLAPDLHSLCAVNHSVVQHSRNLELIALGRIGVQHRLAVTQEILR